LKKLRIIFGEIRNGFPAGAQGRGGLGANAKFEMGNAKWGLHGAEGKKERGMVVPTVQAQGVVARR